MSEILSSAEKAYIGKTNTICIDSQIPIGPFETKIEIDNLKNT
ncbi:hypothetical protein [Thomasclavelia spiroformis]